MIRSTTRARASASPVTDLRERRWVVIAGLVAWLAALAGFRALTSPEEARYSSVAWAMARSRDWLTPMLNGLPFLDKPPLFYWIDAGAMRLFADPQWASRAAPLVGAIAGALVLWRWIRQRCQPRLATWTLLALATLPLFFGGSQFANVDMLVAGCISVTVCCAADSILRAQQGVPHRRLVTAAWIAAAVGVLAKGLIGVVLPTLVLLFWSLATRRGRLLSIFAWPPAWLAFVALAAPWFVAQAWLHPGFVDHFFLRHHLGRFAGTGFNSARSWWFYLVAIPALTLPWSLWLPWARWRRDPVADDDADGLRSLMWIWLATITIFFSIPESKPLGYAMPVLFPLAFLVADAACSLRSSSIWLAKATVAAAALISLAYVLISGVTYDHDHRILGRTLGVLRKTADPVAFLGDYYYDVSIYARLDQPVRVLGDWTSPSFWEADDWRRELAEAAAFDPAKAKTTLVDRRGTFAVACGQALWAVGPEGAERRMPELTTALRILESNGAVLWRLAPAGCTGPATPSGGASAAGLR